MEDARESAWFGCPSGGWLLEPADNAQATYWIPRPPVLRRIDPQLRILSEGSAPIVAFAASAEVRGGLQQVAKRSIGREKQRVFAIELIGFARLREKPIYRTRILKV